MRVQLSKMDGVDLAKVWKEYVWQLELLLPDSTSCQGPWTPTRERMDALTSELVQLMMHLWDSCPDFSRIKVSPPPPLPFFLTRPFPPSASGPDDQAEYLLVRV